MKALPFYEDVHDQVESAKMYASIFVHLNEMQVPENLLHPTKENMYMRELLESENDIEKATKILIEKTAVVGMIEKIRVEIFEQDWFVYYLTEEYFEVSLNFSTNAVYIGIPKNLKFGEYNRYDFAINIGFEMAIFYAIANIMLLEDLDQKEDEFSIFKENIERFTRDSIPETFMAKERVDEFFASPETQERIEIEVTTMSNFLGKERTNTFPNWNPLNDKIKIAFAESLIKEDTTQSESIERSM